MGARCVLGLCALLLAAAVAFSWPLALYLTEGMPYSFMPVPGLEVMHQHPGDYVQLMYRFWLFEQAVAGKTSFFTNAYEFSTPVTPPLFTTQGIPLSFIFMLFMPGGNIFSYNMLILLSFLAAGISFALLAFEHTRSRGAAAAAGLIYACIPYRLGHLFGGHMGGFVFFLAPLTFYCIEKSWRAAPPRGEKGGTVSARRAFLWAVACGACLMSVALLELHICFYTVELLALYMLAKFAVRAGRDGLRDALRVARLPVLGLIIMGIATASYLLWVKFFFLETSAMRGGRTLRVVQMLSPGLKDILCKSNNAEKNVFLGFIPILFAAYGFFARRAEIRRGGAETGALLWLYFWAVLFAACYLLAFGTTLDAYLPAYAWLHHRIPFLAYSRTSSRIMVIAVLGFFMLCAYGLRSLLSLGKAAKAAVIFFCVLSLAEYHTKRPIGVSLLRGMDPVYEEVRGAGKRLLELPIWPGDAAESAIYEYYATLTGVPIVNGYNPAPQLVYIEKVFDPLRSLNIGEMRRWQWELLRNWEVPFIVLHQDLFPRKVSRYPFSFTFRNLLRSPYLRFVRRDGPHTLFSIREQPEGEERFDLTSPVGNLYPAQRMLSDVGVRIRDARASSGMSLRTDGRSGAGMLMRGHPRIYPTGEFRVIFNLKSDLSTEGGPIARIEVFDVEAGNTVVARELGPSDFPGPDAYSLFDLNFRNERPRRVEFRVFSHGKGELRADFAYVVFSSEEDSDTSYEAEDLFHIGYAVEDTSASGGWAVEIGKAENIIMPMVSGPDRLYGPGSYRARFRMAADEVDPGAVVRLEVCSSFGGLIAAREADARELTGAAGYARMELPFELKKLTPLSFRLAHFNRAILRLDRIEVLRD